VAALAGRADSHAPAHVLAGEPVRFTGTCASGSHNHRDRGGQPQHVEL